MEVDQVLGFILYRGTAGNGSGMGRPVGNVVFFFFQVELTESYSEVEKLKPIER